MQSHSATDGAIQGAIESVEAGARDSEEAEPCLLVRAARSVAVERAFTVVDVLHGRALRHYAEGLRQYVAIRLGSTQAAEDRDAEDSRLGRGQVQR